MLAAPGAAPSVDPHAQLRNAVHQALAPAPLAAWREVMARQARARVDALADGEPVDLVTAFGEPWALEWALTVTAAPREHAATCEALARVIYLAAAQSLDGRPNDDTLAAATALARLLAGSATPPGAMADVQTFVALSQTLPALLAGAWRALLCQPVALHALLTSPHKIAGAVGELLRLGSPARAVFREAVDDLNIGSLQLLRGDRVALLLWEANRDPVRFANPERFELARDGAGQLGLGTGPHHCAGAFLVRMALTVATEALLENCASLVLVDDAEAADRWRGGFAMRAPASVRVVRIVRHRLAQSG